MEQPQRPQKVVEMVEQIQSDLFERGTGTDGPRAKPVVLRAKAGPPRPVPYGQALREITSTVLEVLKERGEQWESGPRQDLVSTVFIAAHRAKALVFDFKGAA